MEIQKKLNEDMKKKQSLIEVESKNQISHKEAQLRTQIKKELEASVKA